MTAFLAPGCSNGGTHRLATGGAEADLAGANDQAGAGGDTAGGHPGMAGGAGAAGLPGTAGAAGAPDSSGGAAGADSGGNLGGTPGTAGASAAGNGESAGSSVAGQGGTGGAGAAGSSAAGHEGVAGAGDGGGGTAGAGGSAAGAGGSAAGAGGTGGGGSCPAASVVHDTLTNGGFEVPAVGTASYLNFGPCAEPANFAWAVTTNNMDLVSNGVLGSTSLAYEGTQSVDLVGTGSTGGIKQSFRTTSGTSYTLGFAYANNSISTTTASALVTLASSTGNVFFSQTITHSTSTNSAANWTTFNVSFSAVDSATTLTFENTVGGGNGGIVLDAVSVNAVP